MGSYEAATGMQSRARGTDNNAAMTTRGAKGSLRELYKRPTTVLHT